MPVLFHFKDFCNNPEAEDMELEEDNHPPLPPPSTLICYRRGPVRFCVRLEQFGPGKIVDLTDAEATDMLRYFSIEKLIGTQWPELTPEEVLSYPRLGQIFQRFENQRRLIAASAEVLPQTAAKPR